MGLSAHCPYDNRSDCAERVSVPADPDTELFHHPSFGYYEVSGVENYVQMFGNKEFWKATWNSIYFCILTVPLGIFLSLLTAVLLNAKIRAKAAFRAIYFLPMVVAPAAIAMVWKWISTQSTALSTRSSEAG